MAANVYYYYAGGPKDGTGTAAPSYSNMGLMSFSGINFTGIYASYFESDDNLTSAFIDWLGESRAPKGNDMMIIKIAYTQNDVKYGDGGGGILEDYDAIDGATINIYAPLTGGNFGESGAEPEFFLSSTNDSADMYAASLNGAEENGLFLKYGGLASYYTVSYILNNLLTGPNGIVTQMYTSVITRTNVPNVIRTNSENTNVLQSLEDEASVNASSFSISTSATSTSTSGY